MIGRVDALHHYPVKGFTPQPLDRAALTPGAHFPDDRLYAVENGPSGFDPAAPAHLSKARFTVLARIAALARIKTEVRNHVIAAATEGRPPVSADLRTDDGRSAFADWLTDALDPQDVRGPLRVVSAPGHRFTDHPQGHVSILNLASVAALGERMGATIDPLRFRANVHVGGWPAWAELDGASGHSLRIGGARLELFKPIVRCAAINASPVAGVRDLEVVEALRTLEGHIYCGVYVRVAEGGEIRVGDTAET